MAGQPSLEVSRHYMAPAGKALKELKHWKVPSYPKSLSFCSVKIMHILLWLSQPHLFPEDCDKLFSEESKHRNPSQGGITN